MDKEYTKFKRRVIKASKKLGIGQPFINNIHDVTGSIHSLLQIFFSHLAHYKENDRESLVQEAYRKYPNGLELANLYNELLSINWFAPKESYSVEKLQEDILDLQTRFNLFNILIEKDLETRIDTLGIKLTEESEEAVTGLAIVSLSQMWTENTRYIEDSLINAYKSLNITDLREIRKFKKLINLIDLAKNSANYSIDIAVQYSQIGLNEYSGLMPRPVAVHYSKDLAKYGAAFSALYYLGKGIIIPEEMKNPFEPLLKIYKHGLAPLGLNKDSEFVIYHPPVQKMVDFC